MKIPSNSSEICLSIFRFAIAVILTLFLTFSPYGFLIFAVRAQNVPTAPAADVDAAFFHRGENVSYFFKGNQYFRLTGTEVDPGYPKNLPGEWKGLSVPFQSGIDAAMQDPSSNTIYFFKGGAYAAVNPATKATYPGYENVRLPGGWQGLPALFQSGIDDALEGDDGSVIFFKGNRQVVLKNEKFVSEMDIPAGVLAAGPISAAFKYSNGRNYFFSGGKVSRAIGSNVEPGWLNNIDDVWTGLKPVPREPNSTRVTEVSFGPQASEKGLFRQVSNTTWEYRTGGRPYDKFAASCTETNRGPARILISCDKNAYQFEIDLSTKNVTKITGSQRAFADQVRGTDNFELVADRDLRDPFQPGEINKLMVWISKEVSNSKIPYCYKNSFGRGVGAPLTTCGQGTEKNGSLCYPKCRDGFAGEGPVCWGTCPSGFNDIGAFCQKTGQYDREGFPWVGGDPPLPNYSGPIGRCEAKYGRGACELNGAVVYPKCRAGFVLSGVTSCAPACPAGWEDNGTGCTKPSYGRGVGQKMTCSPGLEEQNALCYNKCQGDFEGIGPICWQNCRGNQSFQCGIGCASDVNSCATATTDMITAPILLLFGLIDFGISAKASAAAKAAAKAGVTGGAAASGGITTIALKDTPKWAKLFDSLKNASAFEQAQNIQKVGGLAFDLSNVGQSLRSEIELWTSEYEDNFAMNTTPAVEAKIRSEYDYNTQRFIKRYWAVHHLGSIVEADGWRIGKLVTSALGIGLGLASIDPGFLATINAFAQPMCPTAEGNPFPRLARN